MGRWTQYEEDSYRLPEGVTRIAYDADTARYTFRDSNGEIFQGAPGEEFGFIRRKASSSSQPNRPIFESDTQRPKLSVNTTSFHDILPAEFMTSPSSIDTASTPASSPTHSRNASRDDSSIPQLIHAVQRSALPKMQSVVHSVMRCSTTVVRPSPRRYKDGDRERLLSFGDGAAPSGLSRGDSCCSKSSTWSGVSTTVPRFHE